MWNGNWQDYPSRVSYSEIRNPKSAIEGDSRFKSERPCQSYGTASSSERMLPFTLSLEPGRYGSRFCNVIANFKEGPTVE